MKKQKKRADGAWLPGCLERNALTMEDLSEATGHSVDELVAFVLEPRGTGIAASDLLLTITGLVDARKQVP